MSAAIVLDNKMTKKEELALPAAFDEINSHNLYLYTKHILQTSVQTLRMRKQGQLLKVEAKNLGAKKAAVERVPVQSLPRYSSAVVLHTVQAAIKTTRRK